MIDKLKCTLFCRALQTVDTMESMINNSLRKSAQKEIDKDSSMIDRLYTFTESLELKIKDRHNIDIKQFYTQNDVKLYLIFIALVLFVIGLGSNYLGASKSVNILLSPFMILLVWNFLMYCLWLLPKKIFLNTIVNTGITNLSRWYRKKKKFSIGEDNSKKKILLEGRYRYIEYYMEKYHDEIVYRGVALLHIGSIIIVSAIVIGLYLRGIVQEYSFGWSSTFIQNEETLREVLTILFMPVLTLFSFIFTEGLPTFSENNGAQWIHLFGCSALVYMIIPRLFLLYRTVKRLRQIQSNQTIDVQDPIFRKWVTFSDKSKRDVFIYPYSYTLSEKGQKRLIESVKELWGELSSVEVKPMVKWGETEWENPNNHSQPYSCIIVFKGVQTPEEEVHFEFMDSVNRISHTLSICENIITLIDKGTLKEQESERKQAGWECVLQNPFGWVSLENDSIEELTEALSKNDIRSENL